MHYSLDMVTTHIVALAHSAASQLAQLHTTQTDTECAQPNLYPSLRGSSKTTNKQTFYTRPSVAIEPLSATAAKESLAKALLWHSSYCDYHEGQCSFGGASRTPRNGGIHQGGVGSAAPTTGSCILVQRACSCSSLHLASCGWVNGGGIHKQCWPQSSCARTPAGDSKPLGRMGQRDRDHRHSLEIEHAGCLSLSSRLGGRGKCVQLRKACAFDALQLELVMCL